MLFYLSSHWIDYLFMTIYFDMSSKRRNKLFFFVGKLGFFFVCHHLLEKVFQYIFNGSIAKNNQLDWWSIWVCVDIYVNWNGRNSKSLQIFTWIGVIYWIFFRTIMATFHYDSTTNSSFSWVHLLMELYKIAHQNLTACLQTRNVFYAVMPMLHITKSRQSYFRLKLNDPI